MGRSNRNGGIVGRGVASDSTETWIGDSPAMTAVEVGSGWVLVAVADVQEVMRNAINKKSPLLRGRYLDARFSLTRRLLRGLRSQ